MRSTFMTLKSFFPLICQFDVLDAHKLAEMCVDDENKHASFPRVDRARGRAESVQRLFNATRAWCTSELVYSYLFSGEKSVKDCWECMKDLRDITLGTAKTEVNQYRNRFDSRYFPSVDVAGRIEYASVSDEQTVVANEGKLNIAEYLFDYCVLVDERLTESKRLIGVFNEQLAALEADVYARTSSIGAGALQRSFDIDLGQFLNGNKRRFEIPPERFRAFLAVMRPYSVQIKRALEKKLYRFADCLSYMDYLRIGMNLTPEEEQMRRELMNVIDGHSGSTVLDRLCTDLGDDLFTITNEGDTDTLVVEEVSVKDDELRAAVQENENEVAVLDAFVGLNEKTSSVEDMPEKSEPKKRGRPKKEKIEPTLPPTLEEVAPVSEQTKLTGAEQAEQEADAKAAIEQMVKAEQERQIPIEVGKRRIKI